MRVTLVAATILIVGLLAAPGATAAPPEPDDLIDPSCLEETKGLYESPLDAAEAVVGAAHCLAK